MATRYVLREVELDITGDQVSIKTETHRATIYDDITEFVAATEARRAGLLEAGFQPTIRIQDANIVIYNTPRQSIALSTSTLED